MKVMWNFVEIVRNVVYLFLGLCVCGFAEKKLTARIDGRMDLMLLVLLADLMLLFVFHRQVIGPKANKLPVRTRNYLIIAAVLIFIAVYMLS
ncbi:hypothetical protein [Paenibacillus sp. VMFN-D1]|uniref:hypothetical protein n=1 Tax=Paenibacillus sp. VMFN-D1 TaxID=2135608 RepID=UPI000E27EE06|nr:hypothetical protein [Paenibacillus sp. VMFN-D1]RED35000.1 hypothetical protein C7820_4666 [Paenibacillus sp. VMFN-D1]